MTWEPIGKVSAPGACFNLADYARSVRDFSWEGARAELDGLPGGRGLNIAHEAGSCRSGTRCQGLSMS
jgi:acetyl-CoA synthetase